MRLFEISAELRALFGDIEDAGGEVTDDQLEALDRLAATADQKVNTVCALVEEAERRIAGRTATLDRLRRANEVDANRVKRLKGFLLAWMTTTGAKRHQTDLHTVSRQASPPSATCIVDPSELPDDFKRVKVEADSRAAIAYWRETGTPPAGFEIHASEHLRLR